MSYFRYRERFGDVLIDLDGIRFVKEVRANPCGGAPRSDSGKITYADGFVLDVSRDCAVALQDAIKSQTDPRQDRK